MGYLLLLLLRVGGAAGDGGLRPGHQPTATGCRRRVIFSRVHSRLFIIIVLIPHVEDGVRHENSPSRPFLSRMFLRTYYLLIVVLALS